MNPQFKEKNRTGVFSMEISSMYYNPIASFWEPLIEQARIVVEMDNFSFKLRCKQGIDINVSDTFIDILAMTWKSWNQKVTRHKSRRGFGSKSMDSEDQDKQGVCPFRVKNKTGTTIYLSKMFGKKDEKDVAIPSGTKYNLCVNYEDIVKTLLKGSSNDVKLTETLYKVSFDPSLKYTPISELQFNEVESKVHQLTELNAGLDYVIWSVTLDNMIKLVTIRTALEFKNKTDYTLKIVFFDAESSNFILAPGDSFCIPVHLMATPFSVVKEESLALSTVQTAADFTSYFASHDTVLLRSTPRNNSNSKTSS